MSELTAILDAIEELAARGDEMALATIVATRGSTYRRAGARLLVPARGEPIGNISGGCLEGDVARIGREVLAAGAPRTVSFDLTADDDALWGYGLGCNAFVRKAVDFDDYVSEVSKCLTFWLDINIQPLVSAPKAALI